MNAASPQYAGRVEQASASVRPPTQLMITSVVFADALFASVRAPFAPAGDRDCDRDAAAADAASHPLAAGRLHSRARARPLPLPDDVPVSDD